MGFLKTLFNLPKIHWGLIVVIDGQSRCAIWSNSVTRIVSVCYPKFKDGAEPLESCGLRLKSNHTNKGFWLRAKHVTPDGKDVTQAFYDELHVIDPDWEERRFGLAEPICHEIKPDGTRGKAIPIWYHPDLSDPNWFAKSVEQPDSFKEITFASLVDEVFER